MSLAGKTVLVTGGANGIGRAIATLAHAEGADVLAVDRDAATLAATVEAVPGLRSIVADVTVPDDVERAVGEAGERLDVLVNNAGLLDRMALVDEISLDEWNRVLAVNLTGPFLFCAQAVPRMVAQGGGTIVNVASVAALQGARAGVAYTSSKHGLIGLTRNVAATFGGEGIRCNAVCPGATQGFGSRGAAEPGSQMSERGMRKILGDSMTLPPIGDAEGIARAVLFLADDEASGRINGTVLVADDGWTAG